MKVPELKFLQIFSTYGNFIDAFYSASPHVADMTASEQDEILYKYGFFCTHAIVPHLQKLGCDTKITFSNSGPMRKKYFSERNITIVPGENEELRYIKLCIEEFKPDIVYCYSPYVADKSFFDAVRHKPALICTWRCATLEAQWNWSCYDIVLTTLPSVIKYAPQLGAKSARMFGPGYPTEMLRELTHIAQDTDVVFVGTLTGPKRIAAINALARGAQQHGFSLGLHLSGNLEHLDPVGFPYLRPQVFGHDTLRALRRGKIVLDARGEVYFDDHKSNRRQYIGDDINCSMRLIEATGGGSLVLARAGHSPWFRWGSEIIAYENENDLVEKVCYYINHEQERSRIAAAAQQRCLEEYSMTRRAAEFCDIVQDSLAEKKPQAEPQNWPSADWVHMCEKILGNSYLHSLGWFRSYAEQKVVDGEGRPLPWMNYPVIELLRERVPQGVDVFEYGCGFGTLWWAQRAHRVVAVEHDKAWFERMASQFPANVRAIYCELVRGGEYCTTAARLKMQKFHIVIVDGRDRVNCALHCAEALTDNGVVIFDDTDREEYAPGRAHLTGLGFKELRIMGLKPMVLSVGAATSIFYKENNCLCL